MNGILYLAVGDKHYEEALVSARSARVCMGSDICIVTDRDEVDGVFSESIHIDADEYTPALKIEAVSLSPFDRTLFLDTDTYILASMEDVFEILDRFDVAAVFQPTRYTWPTGESVPRLYPEFNSGVLAFRKCKVMDELVKEWKKRYEVVKAGGDQGALREALYYGDARLCVLPPECNFRLSNGGWVSSIVRVLHGKGSKEKYESVRRLVNAHGNPRILKPVEFLA